MLVASDGALAVPDPVSSPIPCRLAPAERWKEPAARRPAGRTGTDDQADRRGRKRACSPCRSQQIRIRSRRCPADGIGDGPDGERPQAVRRAGLAIVNLVAGSVPGLSPDAVRVVDQHGRLLSDPSTKGSDRLELQARMEDKAARAARPAADTDGRGRQFHQRDPGSNHMDEVTSAREAYDKNGVVRSETSQQSQQAGGQPGQAGGVPGVLSNTPPPATQATPGPIAGRPGPAGPRPSFP